MGVCPVISQNDVERRASLFNDMELVDDNAPRQFSEYLYEKYRERQPGQSDFHGPEKASLAISAGPVAQAMTVDLTAEGAKDIQQQIIV